MEPPAWLSSPPRAPWQMMSTPRSDWLRLLVFGLLAGSTAGAAHAAPPVEFNRDVRPILAENCFPCHGPDQGKRKANLRLDTPDGAFADRGGRRALVPGDLAHSALYRRITAEEDERMP